MRERTRERGRVLHRDLDTAYTDLSALLVYLEARDFNGLVVVHLDDYEAESLLLANETTDVRATDAATGEGFQGEEARANLLARASEPGGLISVYELTEEEAARELSSRNVAAPFSVEAERESKGEEDPERRRGECLQTAGELIEAVERAALVAGGDFETAMRNARLALTEDYPFLDPFARGFSYESGEVRLQAKPSERLLVSGVCEMLRRAVSHVANAEHRIGVRRDAARELSILLRRRRARLERCNVTPRQLERIAGMKLL